MDEHAELKKAYENGATIEFWSKKDQVWKTCAGGPSWTDVDEYRIKPTRCKYADIFIEAANDSSKVLQVKKGGIWFDVNVNDDEYRIKPVKKTIRFRNYLLEGKVHSAMADEFINEDVKWIGCWQEVEI